MKHTDKMTSNLIFMLTGLEAANGNTRRQPLQMYATT
jgi:hypothetical protein